MKATSFFCRLRTGLTQLCSCAARGLSTLYKRFERAAQSHALLTPLLLAASINLVLEICSHRSLLSGLAMLPIHPFIFSINTLIIFITLSSAFLFARRAFVYTCIASGWLILGITNFVLLGMRNTPLAAIDFSLIVSCFGIITVYLNLFQILLIVLGIALLITALIALFRRTKKPPQPRLWRVRGLLTIAVSGGLFAIILAASLYTNLLSTKFPDLAAAYHDYGFAYCFSLSVLDRGIDRPDTYSDTYIDQIMENLGADTEGGVETSPSAPNAPSSPDAQTPQPPNVIMVQLESFFDVKRLAGMAFSEDPVPNFTALKEAYPSGYLTVPSIGAGTANTEFEILTGMNLYDFGAGEYPYKTILRSSTCESLAYSMRALGASAFALHNNSGTFYERHRIYSSLGFDTFVPLEHMHDVTSNPLGWAKDAVLTPEILTCMDTTAGTDFVFAVSVQPHGKYPDDTTEPEKDNAYDLPSIFDRFFDQSAEDGERVGHSSGNVTSGQTKEEWEAMRISVSGIDNPSLSAQYTYYVNQLYETDLFIGELISALSAREEDTVLVLYGDHLPCFNYTAEDMADSSSPYQTEYVIWSNFDTNTADRDLHAYQLSAYTQMAAGLCEGTLTRLHQSYLSTEEDASAEDTAITAKEAYLSVLELLEYDMLYGDQILWDGCNPYLPSDLQYGVRPIRIHSISVQEQTVYIHGENFTPFSSVLVNDNAKSTKFIDSTLLKITLSGLRSGDSFRIVQCGVDRIPLGGSDVFLYAEPSSEDALK